MLMICVVLLWYLGRSETKLFPFYRLTIDPRIDQLPFGLIAQLVEYCTGIAGVGFGSRSGLNFQAFLSQLLK